MVRLSFIPIGEAMLSERQPLHQQFKMILQRVVDGAFVAAGYALQDEPLQWLSGSFRYRKPLDETWAGWVIFQLLVYTDTAWSPRRPSCFRVQLVRTDQPNAAKSAAPRYASRLLSALIVEDFGVPALPSADYWWPFTDLHTLGHALAHAGKLTIGYGLPWLSSELTPPPSGELSG